MGIYWQPFNIVLLGEKTIINLIHGPCGRTLIQDFLLPSKAQTIDLTRIEIVTDIVLAYEQDFLIF